MASPIRQEYIICYDISDTKKRNKVFNELEKTGMKAVQKSVFWGYLTKAELYSCHRFISQIIEKDDRALITHTNFNGRGQSFLVGYKEADFQDWDENYVL